LSLFNRNSPPSQAVLDAVSQLQELNNAVISDVVKLEFLKSSQDIHRLEEINRMKQLKDELYIVVPYTDIPNFVQEFAVVFDRMQLEMKLKDLKYKVSPESMSLYPDYQNKLNVLKELKYIDDMQQGKSV
jgi:antiviral helicase SKI2